MNGRLELGNVDYNGTGRRINKAAITWELKETDKKPCFSAQAEVWNGQGTDIIMGGQCVDEVAAMFPHNAKAQRIKAVWERYHLNDMRAGCEHQRAGWDVSKMLDVDGQKKAAGWVYQKEHAEGLLCKPCEVCGYKYGSTWLYEAIPADVLAEIKSW